MKGLLLKELYLVNKYCRAYILISFAFLGLALVGNDNLFFIVYPSLFATWMPVTLLTYDERSRWEQFCGGLPYRRAQLVSSKYLVGMLLQGIMLVLTGAVQAVRMIRSGSFHWDTYLTLLVLLFFLSGLVMSITLPLIFKLGTQNAYYGMVGVMCALSLAGVMILRQKEMILPHSGLAALLAVVTVGLYALSWRLSIALYQKREF